MESNEQTEIISKIRKKMKFIFSGINRSSFRILLFKLTNSPRADVGAEYTELVKD